MRQFIVLFLCLFFLEKSKAQSHIYLVKNPLLENTGYWQDSLIYDLDGKVFLWVKGSAVFDKAGILKGWTDKAGILFGRDGQMLYYSEQLSAREATAIAPRLQSPTAHPAIPSSSYFEPLKCYDFLPLDALDISNRDMAARNNGQQRAATANKIAETSAKLKETEALMYERSAQTADILKGVGGLTGNSSASTESPESLRLKAQTLKNEARQERDQAQINRDRTFANQNEFIIPQLTQLIELRNRSFLSGQNITEKDSLVSLYYQERYSAVIPDRISIFAYNSTNAQLKKVDLDYAYAKAAFDSAYELYDSGYYAIAFQWTMHAVKKREEYTNAYLLASACARMMENYELAGEMLDKIKQPEHQGSVKALKAELSYLANDADKASKLIKQAYHLRANDWAAYIQRKYGIK